MACNLSSTARHLVGDPVDVVTGACVETMCDFTMRAPLPFVFRRHYDSSKRHRALPLGWGHTHEYDRTLTFVVDGIRYTSGLGPDILFPPLGDGRQEVAQGRTLTHLEGRRYRLREPDHTVGEFTFTSGEQPARLTRLVRDEYSIEFRYDPHGRLLAIIDAFGRMIEVASDEDGRILSLTRRTGGQRPDRRLIALTYDPTGHLVTGTNAYGHTFSFEYDAHGRIARKTDRLGYAFTFGYDDADRCVRSAGSDGLHDIRLAYFPDEGMTKVTKADGGVWTYFYNESGAITRIIDPYGGATVYEIDSEGRLAREVDPVGVELTWQYDAAGAPLGRRSPFGELLRRPGTPVSPTRRPHRVPRSPLECEFGDLVLRRLIRPPRPGDPALGELPARATRWVWSPSGVLQATKVDADDHRWELRRVFEISGLRVAEHKEDTAPRHWFYDAAGNTLRFQDHDGSVHAFQYTSWNLRSAYADPTRGATRYTYTRDGKVESVRDAGRTVTEFERDLKGRLTAVRRNGEVRDQYLYDAAENMVEKRGRNGAWLLRQEFGSEGVKTVRELASGGTHTFEYDESGRYAKVATDEFDVTFAYDELGRRTSDQRDGRGVEHAFGERGAIERITVFGRFVVGYSLGDAGTIVVTDPTGASQRIDRLGNGLLRRVLSNGASEIVQFDRDGRCRLRHVEQRGRGGSWTRRYGYSGEGDLVVVDDDQSGTRRFEYDAAHRLVRAHAPNGGVASYRYDAAGNLLEMPGSPDVRLSACNRLDRVGGETFEYDGRDHVAVRREGDRSVRYGYDARDMLVRIDDGRGIWEAGYDPLGRRVHKSIDGVRTEFYWDTDRLAAEVRQDGRVRVYVYADAFAVVPFMFVDYDDVDADAASGKPYFVFCDHLGTPVLIHDDAGGAVWTARIEPYGRAVVEEGASIDFALRAPGHYFDAETGLHYNRFRYYDCELRRYIQADPIGLGGGTNLYAFAAGNPLSRVDVRGTCPAPTSGGDDDGDDADEAGDGDDDALPRDPGDDEASLADLSDDDLDDEIIGALQVINEEDGLVFGQETIHRSVVRQKLRELENDEPVTATLVNDDGVIVDGHHGAVAKTIRGEPVDPEDGSGLMPETVVHDWRDMTPVE